LPAEQNASMSSPSMNAMPPSEVDHADQRHRDERLVEGTDCRPRVDLGGMVASWPAVKSSVARLRMSTLRLAPWGGARPAPRPRRTRQLDDALGLGVLGVRSRPPSRPRYRRRPGRGW
jgi:hypothetical protein